MYYDVSLTDAACVVAPGPNSGWKRDKFTPEYWNPFYALAAGHSDGRALFGDDDDKVTMMPEGWYQLRVEQARRAMMAAVSPQGADAEKVRLDDEYRQQQADQVKKM